MAVVIETALERVFCVLLKVVVGRILQTARFENLLKRLENTLKTVEPVFFDSRRLSKVLDRPEKETTRFIFYLENGKELVLKCSKIKCWNGYKKFVHANRLNRLNKELLRFFQMEKQNIMSTSSSMKGIYDLTDKMDQELSAVTSHPGDSLGSCSLSGLGELIVGLDWHLDELKQRLLKADTQVLVVSAPGGCGKTTFAKLFCHDNEIKDIFGENILYVTKDHVGMYTIENLLELSSRNLVNLVPTRKHAGELEGDCNEHYVTQHNLLRELTTHLSSQEPIAKRKRLFMEIYRNKFPTWWIEQIEHPINTRILSISTDEAFSSIWYDLTAPKVEVLTLNIWSKSYALPLFVERMNQLKVLSVTSYGAYPAQLQNISLIGSLSNLRRVRFEHISVPTSVQPIFAFRNLQKLSFIMCEIGDALMNGITESPYVLPNLTDLEIDHCYDLKELPEGLCSLVCLKKLRISNCHELDALPKGLGSLPNLEILSIHSCTKVQELPESIGNLRNLSFLDISDCLSISVLPEQIGELCSLRVLKMSGCQGLEELPVSMSKLSQLEEVVCDEETSYLWMNFESDLYNLKVNVVEDDRFESFMKIIR